MELNEKEAVKELLDVYLSLRCNSMPPNQLLETQNYWLKRLGLSTRT